MTEKQTPMTDGELGAVEDTMLAWATSEAGVKFTKRLIAQAKEANALRPKLEAWSGKAQAEKRLRQTLERFWRQGGSVRDMDEQFSACLSAEQALIALGETP